MLYNGRPRQLIDASKGATIYSVEALRNGIATRGVLLDIAGLQAQPWLEAS